MSAETAKFPRLRAFRLATKPWVTLIVIPIVEIWALVLWLRGLGLVYLLIALLAMSL